MTAHTAPWKKPDTSALRAQLSQLLEAGQNETLLETVVEQMASQNDQLAWRLQTALSQLYRRKSEKISPEQLSLFLAKVGQKAEQANVETAEPQATPEAEQKNSNESSAERPSKKASPSNRTRSRFRTICGGRSAKSRCPPTSAPARSASPKSSRWATRSRRSGSTDRASSTLSRSDGRSESASSARRA